MIDYKNEIMQHVKDMLEYDYDLNDEDLHCKLFNTDYYIIGTYQATKWLGENVFTIVGIITEYEEFQLGERYTDLASPEKVANMYAYILGEECIEELRNA